MVLHFRQRLWRRKLDATACTGVVDEGEHASGDECSLKRVRQPLTIMQEELFDVPGEITEGRVTVWAVTLLPYVEGDGCTGAWGITRPLTYTHA